MTPELQSKLMRWGGTALTVGLIAFNKKLGLDLGMPEIITMAGIIVGAVSGSNWKEAALAGHDAAVQIATVKDAAAVIGTPPTAPAAPAVAG